MEFNFFGTFLFLGCDIYTFEFNIVANVGNVEHKIGDVGSSGYEDKLLRQLKLVFCALDKVIALEDTLASNVKTSFDDKVFTELENAYKDICDNSPSLS